MQADIIEAVKLDTAAVQKKKERNYELDFFRIVFSLLVVLYHTGGLSKEVEKMLPPQLGAGCVHFFFILSGMLMANSIVKRSETQNCAKSSIQFVLNKFKSFALPYIAAMFIGLTANVLLSGKGLGLRISKIFPELFCLYSSGVWMNNNMATWYLPAMLICMLPLAYLLYAKRDLTLYVLAPLIAVGTLGYMCQENDFRFLNHTKLYGALMGGFIKGLCGLCFGICAYTIYIRIKNAKLNRNARILLTFAEVLLYGIFFFSWFVVRDNKAIMSVMLMLPVPMAISFSGQSYVGKLFRFRWMKYFAPLSLDIYLNHSAAEKIVENTIPGSSYGMCVKWMTILTVIFVILNILMVKAAKALWNNKLKNWLTKPDA